MWSLEESPSLVKIYDLLYHLGSSGSYVGFYYVSYAVWLCVQCPERLLLVTKWLYPNVAAHYDTNWKAVERGIRTMINRIWQNDPRILTEVTGYPVKERPGPSQFLSILVRYLLSGGAA